MMFIFLLLFVLTILIVVVSICPLIKMRGRRKMEGENDIYSHI